MAPALKADPASSEALPSVPHSSALTPGRGQKSTMKGQGDLQPAGDLGQRLRPRNTGLGRGSPPPGGAAERKSHPCPLHAPFPVRRVKGVPWSPGLGVKAHTCPGRSRLRGLCRWRLGHAPGLCSVLASPLASSRSPYPGRGAASLGASRE